MKTAKLLWILSSITINIIIAIYISLMQQLPQETSDRIASLQEDWVVWSLHWKAEFVIMTIMTIAAFYFAAQFRKISWQFISVGMLIQLFLYPIMLGGYYQATPETFTLANQMATIVFLFGNVVFMAGLIMVYAQDQILQKWLRTAAILLASVCFLTFSITFLDVIAWKQAMVVAPLANILYLINAYYGYRLPTA